MTHVIELVRVSTEGQAKAGRNGLQAQRRACEETASRFQLRIVGSVELVMSM